MAAEIRGNEASGAGVGDSRAPGRRVRIFVSSPADARFERARVDRVVERLNGEFAGVVTLETIRWEREFYRAHATFQAQIPEAADCDVVIAILKHRLGTELPPDFPPMPTGEPYPSGTAYEVLTAMKAASERGAPDLYVFRFPEPPMVRLDEAEANGAVAAQWARLKAFFNTWFLTATGQFKSSYHEFRTTDEFEGQVESLLRKWLAEKILKGRPVVWPIETKGSPFRGLAAFGSRHAPVFFGRSRDIARSVEMLKDAAERGAPFLLVVGASGVGKSSLARAGILPRLTTPGVVGKVDIWRAATLTPSDMAGGPILSLATKLFERPQDLAPDEAGRAFAMPELAESDYGTPAALAALFDHADETAARPVIATLDKIGRVERSSAGHDRPVRADLVLLVDQLDELFTVKGAAEAAPAFARLLAALVATGRVWVVATLRADLYERFLGVAPFVDLKTKGATYDLAAPGAAELAEIVRGPAAAADLVFDLDEKTEEHLDDRLLADADRPDMLPLLQFTLDQLFDRREVRDSRTYLTFAAYAALGGIAGAVDRQAEGAVEKLTQEERDRLPRLLRQLAEPTRSERSGLAIRAVPLATAAYDTAAARLVDALVEARILRSAGVPGATVVRLSHERVLQNWTRAKDIVAANIDFYRIRGHVEDQRRRFEESGRQRDLLIPSGISLAEAESIAKSFAAELPPETTAFIAASGRRARTRVRLLAVAAFAFAIIAVVAVFQTLAVERRRSEAETQRLRAEENFALAEQSRQDAEAATDRAEASAVEADRARLDAIAEAARAEANRLDAEAATARAEDNAAIAEQNRLEAVAQADRATSNLEAAVDTIDHLTTDVVQGLRNIAGVRVEAIGQILGGVRETLDRLSASDPDNLDLIHTRGVFLSELSTTYQLQGDIASAITAAEASLDDAVTLANAAAAQESIFDGDGMLNVRNLSVALVKLASLRYLASDVDLSEAPILQAIDLSRTLIALSPDAAMYQTDLLSGLDLLGSIRLQRGDIDGALTVLSESLQIGRDLVAANPGDPEALRNLSVALNKSGDLLRETGDIPGARALYDEGLATSRALAAQNPNNTVWARDVGVHLTNLGDVALETGDYPAAEQAYQETLDLSRAQAALDPGNVDLQRDVTVTLVRLGDVRVGLDDQEGARALYQESTELSRVLAKLDPTNLERQRDLSFSLDRLATVQFVVGDFAASEANFREGLLITRRLLAADPESTIWQTDLLISLYKLAVVTTGDERAALIAEGLALVDEMAGGGEPAGDLAVWPGLFQDLATTDGEAADAAPEVEAPPLEPVPADAVVGEPVVGAPVASPATEPAVVTP